MTGHAATSPARDNGASFPRLRMSATARQRLLVLAIAASIAGVFFAIPHTTEDFIYHVPRSRFHLNDEFSLWMWAIVVGVQVAGIALSSARQRAGFVVIALTGAIWVVAALADHTGDVLFRQPWRDAPSSTIWIVGTVVANLGAVVSGAGVFLAGNLPPWPAQSAEQARSNLRAFPPRAKRR